METFGYKLKSVREDEGLSLKDAASITGIRLQHLQALERDDFEALPDELSVKGYLRRYAESLHVNAELMIEDYARECASRRPARAGGDIEVVVEHTPGTPKVGGKHGSRIPLLLSAGGFLVMLVILGSWWVGSRDTTEARRARITVASSPQRNTSAVWPTIPAVLEKSNAVAAVEMEPTRSAPPVEVAPIEPEPPTEIPADIVGRRIEAADR